MIRKLFIGFALFLLAGVASTLRADEVDQKTLFTISAPVSIPGRVVLPAGSYVIKRLDTIQPVVQISDASETHVYATLLAVPEFTPEPSDKPEFTFKEMPAGTPVALQSWRYSGEEIGYEFVPAQAPKESK